MIIVPVITPVTVFIDPQVPVTKLMFNACVFKLPIVKLSPDIMFMPPILECNAPPDFWRRGYMLPSLSALNGAIFGRVLNSRAVIVSVNAAPGSPGSGAEGQQSQGGGRKCKGSAMQKFWVHKRSFISGSG